MSVYCKEKFQSSLRFSVGRVTSERRMVVGFPPRRPVSDRRSGHLGFMVDTVARGQGFSEFSSFPCQFSFTRMPHIHIIGGGIIGPLVAGVTNGLSHTLLHFSLRIKKLVISSKVLNIRYYVILYHCHFLILANLLFVK
jgi:hypothetical protein